MSYSLAEAGLLNSRVILQLLDLLTDVQLAYSASPRARSIADQLAHLHNVRILWLEMSAPAAAKSLSKIVKGAATRAAVRDALDASATSIAVFLTKPRKPARSSRLPVDRWPSLRTWWPTKEHHRGQVILHLKYAGLPIDSSAGYALWEWRKT